MVDPLHDVSMVVGPTLVVTWGMLVLAIFGFGLLALGFAWLIAWVVKRAIATNMVVLHAELKRVVAVAESVDLQYQALRRRVEEVEAVAKESVVKVHRLDLDVSAAKRRLGIPTT